MVYIYIYIVPFFSPLKHYLPSTQAPLQLVKLQACGNLVTRRREGRQMAKERLEVATQWWEALRRLGATVPTEAWWLGEGGKLQCEETELKTRGVDKFMFLKQRKGGGGGEVWRRLLLVKGTVIWYCNCGFLRCFRMGYTITHICSDS